jgi:Peptidase family S41
MYTIQHAHNRKWLAHAVAWHPGAYGLRTALALSLTLGVSACSGDVDTSPVERASAPLRSISTDEALSDFDTMVSAFRGLYGAMARKESRYDFKFDDLVEDYRVLVAEARGEAKIAGIFSEFIARFHDAHVAFTRGPESDDSQAFSLPFAVIPIEDKYAVFRVAQPAGNTTADLLARGDELVSIDGVVPDALVARYAKYVGVPNPISAKRIAAQFVTARPRYAADDLVNGAPATVRLRNPAGEERDVQLAWAPVPHPLPPTTVPRAGASESPVGMSLMAADAIQAESFGAYLAPPFMTEQVRATFGVGEQLRPSADALAKLGVSAENAAKLNYFAVTYTFCGAKFLLLRIPSYDTADIATSYNYLRALLLEQSPQVDGLILDHTHNPGGNMLFAEEVASLLSPHAENGVVQAMHADRIWLQQYLDEAARLEQQGDPTIQDYAQELRRYAQEIDDAYSALKPLSAPIPYIGLENTYPADELHWNKPLVVLIDELSVSAGEFLPLLIQSNGVAPLFGRRTAGGGGNVEEVADLPNLGVKLRLSRGLGTVFDPTGQYPDARFVEDNGVSPDIDYVPTLADFRAGNVEYVSAFSQALLDLLRSKD